MDKESLNCIVLTKFNEEIATVCLVYLKHIGPDDAYFLSWDGNWVKNPPPELDLIEQKGNAKTFIHTIQNIAKNQGLDINCRHPQNWDNFKRSMQEIAKVINAEFKEL